MKKKFLLLPLAAGFAFFSLTSYNSGAGASGFNATGAETGSGTASGCTNGGCHSAGAGINVTIELDSAGGLATTHYKAGLTYTVKITGTNSTSSVYPKFGLQLACIKGSTASATPVNAGNWASGLSSPLRNTPGGGSFDCNLVEQSTPINATTGTGGTGTTYVQSFQWTAPAAGTGDVSFWGVLNAVNGNGSDNGDAWKKAMVTIQEWPSLPTGVDNVATSSVKAYPVPFTNVLNLELGNAAGTTNITVTDMNGRVIANQTITGNTGSINTGSWAQGIYAVSVVNEGRREVITVVK